MLKRWRMSTLVVGGILLNSLVVAQIPGQEEAGQALIQGYVVQIGSGEPLSRAQVMLSPAEGRSPVFGAVTDSIGRFKLGNVRSGEYRLFVERDGYVDRQYGQVSPNRPGTVLVLLPGQQVQDVVIRMVPTGTVAGRVYDEDGEPVVGANVRAMRFDYEDGERVLTTASRTETNDLGEYRLYWLAPGEYYVSGRVETGGRAAARFRDALNAAIPIGDVVVGRGRGPLGLGAIPGRDNPEVSTRNPTGETYVDTYYPGTVDPMAGSAIAVEPGVEIRGVDFAVLPIRAVRVSGEVVSPLADSEEFVTTVNIIARNSPLASGRNDRRGRGGKRVQNGRFELTDVAPGSYTVVAIVRSGQGRGGRAQALTGFTDMEGGGQDIEGLRIQVRPGVSIEGQVLVDQSASEIDTARLRVRLESVQNIAIGSPNARVGSDGTFVIDNVSPTTYRALLVGLPEGTYLAAGRAGARDVLSEGIKVVGGVDPIEFWLSGAGGTVDGTVQIAPDQTFTGAQVVLIPNTAVRTDLYKVASADQYGRFSMRGIAPGRYEIFAWEDAPSGAYRDPEFVRRYRDMGESVEIEQGSQISVQPRMIPAGS